MKKLSKWFLIATVLGVPAVAAAATGALSSGCCPLCG